MTPDETVLREQLGLAYERVLLPVFAPGFQALRDGLTGRLFPTQWAPATPFDSIEGGQVQLLLLDLEAGEELQLTPSAEGLCEAAGPRVTVEDGQAVVVNGAWAVRLPRDGWVEQPFPGPIEGFKAADGRWFGSMSLAGAPLRGHVSTVVEALGPCCVQWRTVWRWGEGGAASWLVRWAAGADTLLVAEEVFEDSEAAVEWFPFGTERAGAFVWGGGERTGPMQPLAHKAFSGARRGSGRRLIGRLSHISYFNQWNFSWVGFSAGDERFVGVFTGWGGLWRRRGRLRPEIWRDDERGDFLRFPLRQGTRLFGIVLSDRERSGIDAPDRRCLLNRRKTQLSDLRLQKTLRWQLDAPAGRGPRLVREADLAGFRERLASDPDVADALDAHAQSARDGHPTQVAAALWKGDETRLRSCVRELLDFADKTARDAAEGGYECIIIFHGRRAKRVAYDLDVLCALGMIEEADRGRVCSALLTLAHIFADPDYCRPEDFWPERDPGEGMAQALRDDMGDCPVPPNFLSEFFSTTAVVAELLEEHPLSRDWRAWAVEQLDRFLDTFFEPDGTYHESVNYHSHALNELLCHLYPLWHKGVQDYFADRRVKGSFAHLVQIQMPALSNALAADGRGKRCPLPADGNSGGEGAEMDYRGELMVAAAVYREPDPELAGRLAHAWRQAGRPLLDAEHPVLTLLTLDPRIAPVQPVLESCWRHSLGVVSKASTDDGSPVWCLFRAGRATHHMDFDQGNLHLAAWDTVLLGDYGYHAHDSEGKPLVACETWLHNTVVYSRDRRMTSGYTGLERAPEPVTVHLGKDFDWVVHRIVNTNFRRLDELSYRDLAPAPATLHVRCYLFVKPHYFLLWDTFEEAHEPSTFWLHPWAPVVEEGEGLFRAGEPGRPHLRFQFLLPRCPEVIENRQVGPLWSFAVSNDVAKPYLVLLAPQREDRRMHAALLADGLTVEVRGEGVRDVIRLPEPGCWSKLPEVGRKS